MMGKLPFNPSTSHCLVRVEPIDDPWLDSRTGLLSKYITEPVFERIHVVTMAQLSKTPMHHLTDPDAHAKAGVLSRAYSSFFFHLVRASVLTMTPLSSGSKSEACIPVPPVGRSEKSHYYSLAIWGLLCSQKVHRDFPGLYMTRIAKNEAVIDALFISLIYTTLLLFQMTVSGHHSINF